MKTCYQEQFNLMIRLEEVLKTYDQDEYIGHDQDVLKTLSKDVWLRWIYSSSRRLHQDECLLGVFARLFFLSDFARPNAPHRYWTRNLSKPVRPKSTKNLWMNWKGFCPNLSFTVAKKIVNLHEIRLFTF